MNRDWIGYITMGDYIFKVTAKGYMKQSIYYGKQQDL